MHRGRRQFFILFAFGIGILMGALDHGILIPARHPIQRDFHISSAESIWMVTIYTLLSAVTMPLVSKLSDRIGRRPVFVASIITFAAGSLLAGLANFFPSLHSYPLFLLFRAIQAAGAGGLIPIASAEISASFPEERRGMALGMIGGIYGMASVLGPTLGSALLKFGGEERWGALFLINLPLALLVIVLSGGLSKSKERSPLPFDTWGAVVLSAVVLTLLYGLSNLNFFQFKATVTSLKVAPFLAVSLLLMPLLAFIELRASDPILSPRYFKSREIQKILTLSFLVGIRFMFIIFMAQFVENVLLLAPGQGGYHITFMALCAGVSAPACGRLCDRVGAKPVLAAGFLLHVVGFLELAFLAPLMLNQLSIIAGLMLVGVGMGFTMGTPLNYLMLREIKEEEAATGLATLALVRSIGVTISPGILVGFVSDAGGKIRATLQELFPMFGRAAGGTVPDAEIKLLFENASAVNVMDKIRTIIPEETLAKIDWMLGLATPMIQETFQKTMNTGFKNLFLTVAILSAVALLLIPFLKRSSSTR